MAKKQDPLELLAEALADMTRTIAETNARLAVVVDVQNAQVHMLEQLVSHMNAMSRRLNDLPAEIIVQHRN
jgi:ABC-type transporter Mla subunit MlaD